MNLTITKKAYCRFIVEPGTEKRLNFLQKYFAATADAANGNSLRFQFENDSTGSAAKQTVRDEIKLKKYFFNGAKTDDGYGGRWLTFGEEIRNLKEKNIVVAVDSFDELMGDDDSLIQIAVSSEHKSFSQSNAGRFSQLLETGFTADVNYLLGVSDLKWLIGFLGYGELLNRDSFLISDLYSSKMDSLRSTVPSVNFQKFMFDSGTSALHTSSRLSLIFISSEGVRSAIETKMLEAFSAPPPPDFPDAGILVYQPLRNQWQTKIPEFEQITI